MIVYLPVIYPDELVYSWFCRYYVHSGCFSHKIALQELYCKRSDNPSKEFIGNLNPEAKGQIEKIYSLDALILNHTMYPQYARFIPLEQKKKALYHLKHDCCDIHYLFPVLPRNEGERYLRYCPLCAREDREIYGEAYWHRKHQIRSICTCAKHTCRLIESDVSAKSEQSFTFCPAENHICQNEAVFEDNVLMNQYTAYFNRVFDAPIDFDKDIPVSSILYDGMSRTKYLKPSGRSRHTKLFAGDMNEFYRGICNTAASIYQIQRTLLGSGFDFSVICQTAFFLGIKPEDLTSPCLTAERIQQEQDSHYMKDSAPVDWDLLDAENAPVLEKIAEGIYNGSANENGRPERVSERLVYRELGLLGQQLENMPKCKTVFEQYTEPYPENWARKIIWAYKRLKESGEDFCWTDIRKISGVKKKNFELTIPYLIKHTDARIADQIIALMRF